MPGRLGTTALVNLFLIIQTLRDTPPLNSQQLLLCMYHKHHKSLTFNIHHIREHKTCFIHFHIYAVPSQTSLFNLIQREMVSLGSCLCVLEAVTALCPSAINTSYPKGKQSLDSPSFALESHLFHSLCSLSLSTLKSSKPRCLITCVLEAFDKRQGF